MSGPRTTRAAAERELAVSVAPSRSQSGLMGLVMSLQKELECPVCLDIFYKPNVISCGHVFCGGCIHKHVSSNRTQQNTCPLCKLPFGRSDINPCQNMENLANAYATSRPMSHRGEFNDRGNDRERAAYDSTSSSSSSSPSSSSSSSSSSSASSAAPAALAEDEMIQNVEMTRASSCPALSSASGGRGRGGKSSSTPKQDGSSGSGSSSSNSRSTPVNSGMPLPTNPRLEATPETTSRSTAGKASVKSAGRATANIPAKTTAKTAAKTAAKTTAKSVVKSTVAGGKAAAASKGRANVAKASPSAAAAAALADARRGGGGGLGKGGAGTKRPSIEYEEKTDEQKKKWKSAAEWWESTSGPQLLSPSVKRQRVPVATFKAGPASARALGDGE